MSQIFVIDTETGGIDPTKFSLLTFAGAVWQDGKIIETIEISIREPRMRVEPEAMSINRIDLDKHLQNSITPKHATKLINEFLSRHFGEEQVIVAGHNIGFDIGFLKRLYRLARENYQSRFSRRSIDTASILGFLNICGLISLPNPSLDKALTTFGIPVENRTRHTALGDVLLTCQLLNKLISIVQNSNSKKAVLNSVNSGSDSN